MKSRDQGFQSYYFFIYEFMGEAQEAAAAREEGGSLWKRAATVLVEPELEPWVSLYVEQSLR